MTIGGLRTLLYGTARFLGDVNAVKRGKVKERLVNRGLGYLMGRFMGWIVRGMR